MMKRIIAIAALAAGSVALIPSPAYAHGDGWLVDDTVTIAPGETHRAEGDVHYHRVVGRVHADRPILLRLLHAATGSEEFAVRVSGTEELNRLVRCCDDAAWSRYVLVMANDGQDPVTVRARVSLIHDDLAVAVDRAESGVAASVIVIGAVWAALARRAWRRAGRDNGVRAPAVALGCLVATVAAISAYGTARYGTGGAPSFLAGAFDVPLIPVNPIAARGTVLVAVALVAWGWTAARWLRARDNASSTAWRALGIAHLGVVTGTAVAVTSAYGNAAMPAAYAVAAALPVAVALATASTLRPGLIVES